MCPGNLDSPASAAYLASHGNALTVLLSPPAIASSDVAAVLIAQTALKVAP